MAWNNQTASTLGQKLRQLLGVTTGTSGPLDRPAQDQAYNELARGWSMEQTDRQREARAQDAQRFSEALQGKTFGLNQSRFDYEQSEDAKTRAYQQKRDTIGDEWRQRVYDAQQSQAADARRLGAIQNLIGGVSAIAPYAFRQDKYDVQRNAKGDVTGGSWSSPAGRAGSYVYDKAQSFFTPTPVSPAQEQSALNNWSNNTWDRPVDYSSYDTIYQYPEY